MDEYFFFGFRNRGTIHCNYTDWNRQDKVEYNSECVHLKEEYQIHFKIHLQSKSLANFHFWVNYPFKSLFLCFVQ